MQDQVTLGVRAVAAEPDRLKLEGQVVAERPVQAEMRIVARERGDHLAQGREHGGAATPVLPGDQPGRLRDDHLDLARIRTGEWLAGLEQRLAQHREEHLTPGVQGPDRDPAAAGHDLRARVHVGQVPAAVPAWILHPGAEHPAAPLVHAAGEPGEDVRVEGLGGAGDVDATGGDKLRPLDTLRIHLVACFLWGLPPAAGERTKRPPLPDGRFWLSERANQQPPNGGATTGGRRYWGAWP